MPYLASARGVLCIEKAFYAKQFGDVHQSKIYCGLMSVQILYADMNYYTGF